MRTEWRTRKLKEVTTKIGSGSTPRGGESVYKSSGVPLIRSMNVHFAGFKRDGLAYLDDKEAAKLNHVTVEAGDVLLNITGASIGRVTTAPESLAGSRVNQHVCIIRPTADLSPRFLAHYLASPVQQAQVLNVQVGVTRQALTKAMVENWEIPLPALDEQREIVAEIEKQFTRLEAGVAGLRRVQANLKRYRAAVLKAACEGKLVPTEAELARQEGRSYETGAQLLERILTERRQKWNGKGKYKEAAKPHTATFPQPPEGWTWIELGQLAWSVKDGPHYSPKYVDHGIPFITGGNVRPSGVDFENAKRISAELHAELSKRCMPEYGDILYTKGGTTGIARVNTYREEFNVWVHVAVLKLTESIEPFFVQHMLNSPFCYAQAQRFTHGVGNQDLGLTRMVHIAFSLPPLAEQKRIVAEVDRRLSVVEELEGTVDANLQRTARLRQSVLQRTFTGELIA